MPVAINWKGKEVRDKVVAATILGIDATMAAAVRHAKANHPGYPPASLPGERYANRTGFLTNSIVIKAPAVDVGAHVRGTWGTDANYGLFVEIGTSRRRSGAPRAEVRAAVGPISGMWSISPPSVPPQMAPRYFLRPAADDAYIGLGARIGAAFRGEELV